jgi:hypothetical protein
LYPDPVSIPEWHDIRDAESRAGRRALADLRRVMVNTRDVAMHR